jgi:hypothetical protein
MTFVPSFMKFRRLFQNRECRRKDVMTLWAFRDEVGGSVEKL